MFVWEILRVCCSPNLTHKNLVWPVTSILMRVLEWQWARAIFQDVRDERWWAVFDGRQYGVWALLAISLYYIMYYIITTLLCSNIAISFPPCLLFILFLLFPNGGAARSDIKFWRGIFDSSIYQSNRKSWQTLGSPCRYPPPTNSEIIICSFLWRAPYKPSRNPLYEGPGIPWR